MLQLVMNGDGRSCSIVDEKGVAVADGVLRPVQGAVDLIEVARQGEDGPGTNLRCDLYFDGKVV